MEDFFNELSGYFSLSKVYVKFICLILIAVGCFGIGQIISGIVRNYIRSGKHPSLLLLNAKIRFSASVLFTTIILNIGLQFLNFENPTAYYIKKFLFISFVFSLAFLLIRLAEFARDYIYYHRSLDIKDNLSNRKIRTQIDFLQKIATVFIIIISVSIVLMSFTRVREVGTSIIASAGIAGIIIGFAAQKSIANLLAGFQIAFTQPLRIDDVVVVENEWGKIEEITLTYVVLKIWDERRLVLPIIYFIDKPFQNWTRQSTNIIGTVFFYADYTVDVDSIRAEMNKIVSLSPLWDKKVSTLQVTDCTEKSVQLRAIVSAANASDSWELKCHLREKMLNYMVASQPESLPTLRSKSLNSL